MLLFVITAANKMNMYFSADFGIDSPRFDAILEPGIAASTPIMKEAVGDDELSLAFQQPLVEESLHAQMCELEAQEKKVQYCL